MQCYLISLLPYSPARGRLYRPQARETDQLGGAGADWVRFATNINMGGGADLASLPQIDIGADEAFELIPIAAMHESVALSGRAGLGLCCPRSGVKRTCCLGLSRSANDPERTLSRQKVFHSTRRDFFSC
jgi:hypothetical protein